MASCGSTNLTPDRHRRPFPGWGDPRGTAGLRHVRLGHRLAADVRRGLPRGAGRARRRRGAGADDGRAEGRPGASGPCRNAGSSSGSRRPRARPAAAMLGHGGFGTTMGALAAGVPQVVAPLFSFDQVVNGDHVAAVGAGLTVEVGPGSVERAATQIPGCSIARPTPPRHAVSQPTCAGYRRPPAPSRSWQVPRAERRPARGASGTARPRGRRHTPLASAPWT